MTSGDRLRIDTSVLGGCFDPEFATWSNGLVREFRAGRLIPVLSDVTAAEVRDAPERVRELHQEILTIVEMVLPLTENALALVAAYAGFCRRNTRPTCGTSRWPPSTESMRW